MGIHSTSPGVIKGPCDHSVGQIAFYGHTGLNLITDSNNVFIDVNENYSWMPNWFRYRCKMHYYYSTIYMDTKLRLFNVLIYDIMWDIESEYSNMNYY